uniref:Multicomponent Na+:H+ antiporter subunit G n=1 Tax=Candidatus Kentrum sp. FM TaxID=2126340 RepID=A0A450SNJ7_9GAMM|nr:MAG: multicomponent Na+:H+ antiporter subunit G [Candidatus Kentron sp. FM]VFJ55403.1 MAG: multicomponent Na+:H+ antiporter subunit G [Candidatus Kentron sp. FM]VFK09829.1 MAG: multicomponent Na+:H+ antiporter subunit G [Candidatus Kentron sp. FM]
MGIILDVVGAIFLIAGASFLLLCGVGLLRMPDIFNRIQAGTKATTLGTLLTLTGAVCLRPEWVVQLFLIGLFLFFTNPLSSQVLARSAHRSGVKKSPLTKVDRLAEDLEGTP